MHHFLRSFFALTITLIGLPATAEVLDQIRFGDPASAQAHAMVAQNGETIIGALDTPAERLLPPAEKGWLGGKLTFTMKVDPTRPNYFTAKFWGGDVTGQHSRLMLFIDGKQVGQRHLGEVDMLDIMKDDPRFSGRFFYKTLPLPPAMTAGKQAVELAIQAQGPIWGYGDTAAKYQKMMTKPSRGIYRGYTHTHALLMPGADEIQGAPAPDAPAAATPGAEVVDDVRQRIDATVKQVLDNDKPADTHGLHLLMRTYQEPWSVAYQNSAVIEKLVAAIDHRYHEYIAEPDDTVGHWWVGYGPDGEAIHQLHSALEPHLDHPLEGTNLTRRAAWADLLEESRDWHAERRRSYSNQSMIVDVNIYRADLGLRVLAPERAWPEDKGLRLLHEAAGIEPWSGNWGRDGSREWRKGKQFYLLTQRALSKELGYVGAYGEIIFDLVLSIYNATRPTPAAEGDPRIKAQLVKLARARSVFRHPSLDAKGHRTMRVETVVGWRDWYYPGGVAYDQISGREGGSPDVAGATLDPVLIGYHQQMMADNQLYAALKKRAAGKLGTNAQKMASLTLSLRGLAALEGQAASPHRLPMTPGAPDFVFADPEIGVVAIKNGDDIVYASLYWRARYAINNLARVHHFTPTIERDVTVNIETRFDDSGHVFTMPDQTNEPFSTRHEKFYKSHGMHLATAGTRQPIATVPADQTDYEPGKENIYAGKGDFYRMDYGPYLIAMNCTNDQAFSFDLPEGFRGATDLVTQQAVSDTATTLSVPAGETVVLFACCGK